MRSAVQDKMMNFTRNGNVWPGCPQFFNAIQSYLTNINFKHTHNQDTNTKQDTCGSDPTNKHSELKYIYPHKYKYISVTSFLTTLTFFFYLGPSIPTNWCQHFVSNCPFHQFDSLDFNYNYTKGIWVIVVFHSDNNGCKFIQSLESRRSS